MSENRSICEVFYPETAVGGFSSVDGTVQFFTRVNALLRPDMTVLDLGAGRGEYATDDPVDYRRNLRVLRGKVRAVIGIDVSEAVRSNPVIDVAHVVQPGARWPLEDRSIDLIVSDYTFEHLSDPSHVVAEIERVLKPGGWLCARTPNKWGYNAIGARLIPNSLHERVLAILQPDRKAIDIFPTTFRLNTRKVLARYFDSSRWDLVAYTWNAEPAYFGKSVLAWWFAKAMFRFTPQSLGSTWFIFCRAKPSH